MKLAFPVFVAACTILTTAPASAAVAPVRGSIYQFVYASDDYLTSGGDADSSYFYDNWTDTPATLAAARTAFAAGTDGTVSSVTTTANINAVWNSAYTGSVDFTDVGWTTSNVTAGYSDLSAVQTNPSEWADRSWTYTFTPDVDSVFVLDYNVFADAGNTSAFGIGSFRFSCYQVDGCEGTENQTVLTAGNNGQLSFEVQAGQQASFYLDVSGAISGGLGTRTTLVNGEFDWHITPVPEPQTWAMLIAGMALVSVRVARHNRS